MTAYQLDIVQKYHKFVYLQLDNENCNTTPLIVDETRRLRQLRVNNYDQYKPHVKQLLYIPVQHPSMPKGRFHQLHKTTALSLVVEE